MRTIWKSVAQWRNHRRECRELGAFSDRELADLGISRSDIPEVVRGHHR